MHRLPSNILQNEKINKGTKEGIIIPNIDHPIEHIFTLRDNKKMQDDKLGTS